MSSGNNTSPLHYFVPDPSRWPMVGSLAMLFTTFGAAGWVNHASYGPVLVALGMATLIYMLFGWFGTVAGESEARKYGNNVDRSFRWGMSWFIFSEVMFFGAFFGALFYARAVTMPWLGDIDHKAFLWPDFGAAWPNKGPAGTIEPFTKMTPFWVPTINTLLLLSSGVTLTIAHHALKESHRSKVVFWMCATILLGAIFMGFQIYEYAHAYSELNLKLTSGIYGSTFFMLTGFHGFHVTMGALMLFVVMVRVAKGHFTSDHHFAFEGAAWYWHFVDVVWLGLYVVVYWL